MTSTQWQEKIADLTTEIASKESRLRSLPEEKRASLSDPKKLTALEAEEDALPGTLARLQKRLPLFRDGLEEALKTEGGDVGR